MPKASRKLPWRTPLSSNSSSGTNRSSYSRISLKPFQKSPLARVRKTKINDFATFATQETLWLRSSSAFESASFQADTENNGDWSENFKKLFEDEIEFGTREKQKRFNLSYSNADLINQRFLGGFQNVTTSDRSLTAMFPAIFRGLAAKEYTGEAERKPEDEAEDANVGVHTSRFYERDRMADWTPQMQCAEKTAWATAAKAGTFEGLWRLGSFRRRRQSARKTRWPNSSRDKKNMQSRRVSRRARARILYLYYSTTRVTRTTE